jgi:3-polyprenyl-4-hydroxybenzoate decarboxylase
MKRMEKVLGEQDYQGIEEAIEELFDSEPGSEEAEKLRELVRLVRESVTNPRHLHSDEAYLSEKYRIPKNGDSFLEGLAPVSLLFLPVF